jgi:DNA polymerase-3 subunit gamma/tau
LSALSSALGGDAEPSFRWIKELYERGADFRLALESLQELLRGLLLVKSSGGIAEELELLPESVEQLKGLAPKLGLSHLLALLRFAAEAESQMRYSSNPRLVLELFLVRLGSYQWEGSLGELFDELSEMEKRLKQAPSAVAAPTASPSAPGESKALSTSSEESHAVVEIQEAALPTELSLETIKNGWENLVEKASSASIMLGTCVRDVELLALKGNELQIQLRAPRQREVLEKPEHRKQLEGFFLELFGKPLTAKLLFQVPSSKPEKAAPSSGKPNAEELERLQKEIPQLKQFQEIFDAEIIDIKRN